MDDKAGFNLIVLETRGMRRIATGACISLRLGGMPLFNVKLCKRNPGLQDSFLLSDFVSELKSRFKFLTG